MQTGKFANCASEIGFLPNFCAYEIRFCTTSVPIFGYNFVWLIKITDGEVVETGFL